MALRLSLGASRGRILRQLFAESLVLATISALVGLTLAAFDRQETEAAFEIVVCDDGSVDGTGAVISRAVATAYTVAGWRCRHSPDGVPG